MTDRTELERQIAELQAQLAAMDAEPDWLRNIEWHKPAHRAVMASVKLGAWMSAALDDPKVCDAMKADIQEWFSAGEPMELLGQALEAATLSRVPAAAWPGEAELRDIEGDVKVAVSVFAQRHEAISTAVRMTYEALRAHMTGGAA